MVEYILCGIFSLFGFVMWLSILIKKNKYKIKLVAKITSSKTDYIILGESASKGNHCKYEFVYNGKKYEIEDEFYESDSNLKEGDDVEIYIDETNPYNFLTPAKIKYEKIYFACFIFGIIAMFVF